MPRRAAPDKNLSPSQRVIARLGGISATASGLGKPRSTIQRWWENGHIHARHHTELLDLAVERGVQLPRAGLISFDPRHPGLEPAADGIAA